MFVDLQVAIQNKCRFSSTMFEIPEGAQKIKAGPWRWRDSRTIVSGIIWA